MQVRKITNLDVSCNSCLASKMRWSSKIKVEECLEYCALGAGAALAIIIPALMLKFKFYLEKMKQYCTQLRAIFFRRVFSAHVLGAVTVPM
jgi:hypothetical protein